MDLHIFPALSMTNSTYDQPLPAGLHPRACAAFDEQGKTIQGLWHHYPEQAAAGLWTTSTDLARYCMAIQEIFKG